MLHGWRRVSLGISAFMLLAYPLYLMTRGGSVSLYPNAAWLALGVFAQAGIAEEVVFRGYLYGRIRRSHSFWRAALLSMAPFALVHLTMFAIMDWPIALAALVFSVLVSFPLAYRYDLGGGTVWAPAIAHAVIQGAIKFLVIDDPRFPLLWMAASIVAMRMAFAFRSSAYSRS